MPEGQEDMPSSTETPRPNPEGQEIFQPSWVLEKQTEFTDPYLLRVARVLHKTPNQMLSRDRLENFFFQIQDKEIEGGVDEGEADTLSARISARIEKLDETVSSQAVSPQSTLSEQQVNSSEFSSNIDSQFKALGDKVEKMGEALGSEKLSSEEQTDLVKNFLNILERQQDYLRNAVNDPELGAKGGVDVLPDAREVGAGPVQKLFRERLQTLIEEQSEQSFDQNWRLVYPLELTIMSLMPRRNEDDQVGPEDAKFSLSKLRKELSTELQAYRNIHNFIYVYRRTGGVTPLIEAASLLPRETINVLLHIPEVAEKLRKIESLGERISFLQEREYRGEVLSLEEKNDLRQNDLLGKKFMVNRDQTNFWACRIAGGLYSGLHESSRHDFQINESGDFFSNRIFHTKERAKGMWEETWGRLPRPGLYEALDLRMVGFWQKALDLKLRSMTDHNKTTGEDDFLRFCQEMKIDVDLSRGRIIHFDLSKALFEKINFTEAGTGLNLAVKTDQVKQVNLDLDDANNVRKAIFDPKGFIDEPRLEMFAGRMNEIFKHLKGKLRSSWIKGVAKETILLFQDTVAPEREEFSPTRRKCPGKEIFPKMIPWSNQTIENKITNITPPLTTKDREEILEEFIGSERYRESRRSLGVATDVGRGVLGEFFKAIFGLK